MKRLIFILLVGLFISREEGHTCNLDECSYRGVMLEDAQQAVTEKSGCEPDTDCFLYDLMHFKHPEADTSQLQSLLFNPQ